MHVSAHKYNFNNLIYASAYGDSDNCKEIAG